MRGDVWRFVFQQGPPWRAIFISCRRSVRRTVVLIVVRRWEVEHELDGAVVGLERKHAADHEKRLARILEFDEIARLRYVPALIVGKAGAGLFSDGLCCVFGEFDRDVGGHAGPVVGGLKRLEVPILA